MRWQYALLVLGILVCLIAGYLMGWGEPILGEDHTGTAWVILIAGLCIIITSAVSIPLAKSKKET
ncbi:hypothetical protein GH146_02020 [archaeon]|jgi:O-antigen/teichoic acid export membrane protein|nr:hypothetical protein [archaeon]TET25653.1 MAG: hypothetical protein E3J73_05925 [Candidatus Bathyarchaeum sp.]